MGDTAFDSYTYLLINIFSISIPFLLSFEKRVHYYRKWKALFPAIFIMSTTFIAWDIWFTKIGVWGFNPQYLTGIYFLNLPIEEWLFFFCIPYSCLFIYEVLGYFFGNIFWEKSIQYFNWLLFLICISGTVLFYDKLYSLITFSLTALFLFYLILSGPPKYLGRFYAAYFISFIPFFIVNGILTGTGIEDQVVWYNNQENMGIRLGTIPLEDTVYSLLILLTTTYFFEIFREKMKFQ